MKKLYVFYRFLPALVFLAFLAGMTALLLFGPHRDFSVNEKRVLAQAPSFDAEKILSGESQKELESFASDQVPFRDLFVGIDAYWTLATGRSGAEDIYFAKDGYLVNAPKAFDEERLKGNLLRFDAFAEQAGIPGDLLPVPTTGWLVEGKLPPGHGSYHDDQVFRTAKETLRHLRVLDPRQILRTAQRYEPVCYRTDHHYTAYGNYLLDRVYQAANGAGSLDRADYTVTSCGGFFGTTWSGSGYWLTPGDTVELWDSGAKVRVTLDDGDGEMVATESLFFPEHLEELDKYPVYLDGNHGLVTIENPDAPGGSVLLLRDSFAHCFATFLAAQYKTVYLVDLRYYRSPVSDFLAEHPVDRLLVLYGVDDLLTDANIAWLS